MTSQMVRFFSQVVCQFMYYYLFCKIIIIESVDSISRDERDVPLTQYITNA